MMFREGFGGWALIVALAFGVAGRASAQVTNGGFEAGGGSLSSWDKTGHAFASDTTLFPTPTEGSFQGTLATQLDGGFGEPAGIGSSGSTAETFLGLQSGALGDVGNGSVNKVSALAQTVHLAAGDKLVFDYNFLTNEVYADDGSGFSQRPSTAQDDFSFFSVSTASTSTVVKLLDVFYGYADHGNSFTTGFTLTPVSDPFISESGYRSFSWTASATGDYKLGFGVANAFNPTDDGINSGLVVDNVHVVPVPEPAAFVALGLGFAGFVRRRKLSSRLHS